VNSRITGRQHATRDIQALFCVHAEILCNSKEKRETRFEAGRAAGGTAGKSATRCIFNQAPTMYRVFLLSSPDAMRKAEHTRLVVIKII
jgi:hypothetical protein